MFVSTEIVKVNVYDINIALKQCLPKTSLKKLNSMHKVPQVCKKFAHADLMHTFPEIISSLQKVCT